MLYLPREGGQGLVEYAMILIFVAIVIVIILTVFGSTVGNLYSTITGAIP